MTGRYSGEPRLVESDLRLDLGKGKIIFVASTHDLFAEAIPSELIERVLGHLKRHPANRYLLQTKNPPRFIEFDFSGLDVIFGTTLESNRDYGLTQAPPPFDRALALSAMPRPKMVSIEPVMDFDLDEFVGLLTLVMPDFVSVGADSKRHGLSEPSANKLMALIAQLYSFTEVRQKSNLARLLPGGGFHE